ncbi:ComF family protein [Umboniibacter marinipuniceus]|uniref:ComF family protein n=1 Tax=Umboniibacter marinipuniceus TaxID=569599 RepID=A0A3M0AAZ1_9GAMM|nr:ComF family protein [Umboniibacter marinipuniceus]RMA82333.1 ComF family protein [Umboniibacter marinipuniceus]
MEHILRKLRSIVNQISPDGLHWRQAAQSLMTELPFECPFCRCSCVWPDRCCGPCANELPWNRQACRRCAHPLQRSADHCLACPPHNWDIAYSACYYRLEIRWALSNLKQSERLDLGALLGQLLEQYLSAQRVGSLPDAIIPIPISRRRFRERGFNQVEAILKGMTWRYRNRVQPLLRVSSSANVKGRNATQRWRRDNPFEATQTVPERIAIVDDIHTTGSTLSRATETLRDAGAKYVEVWTVARTPRPGYGDCYWLSNADY